MFRRNKLFIEKMDVFPDIIFGQKKTISIY